MSLAIMARPLRRSLSSLQPTHRQPPLLDGPAQCLRRQSSMPPTTPTAQTNDGEIEEGVRYPRSIQLLHLNPLRREAKYGVPCCDLQMRSYSLRNLEFFADFALRAAYYLSLPAFGPVPLPRLTERWTVPRSSFIFKKSQENFERVTVRRLIQIRDGHPENVQTWLAVLQRHAYYGIGMKANVWEFGKLESGESMDSVDRVASGAIEDTFAYLGQSRPLGTGEAIEDLLRTRRFKPANPRSGFQTR